MMRGMVWTRLAILAGGAALVSCTSALSTISTKRVETRLSSREKRRIGDLLGEMAAGWDGMQHGKIAARRQAQDRYDRALADFLREWDDAQSPRYWESGAVFESKSGSFQIELNPPSDPRREISPAGIDEMILPYRVKPRELDTLAQRAGVGVPLVGHVRPTREVRRAHPFIPPNGGNLTLTATMEIGDAPGDPGAPRVCRLRLHNTLNVETVKLRGDERQLAAHFTASKQRALSKRSLNPFAWLGILYPETTLKDCQLYQMDVYDRDRIPLIFVHGLMSDPHIWLNVVNAISADKELRAAYQPWYFLYPTALGIPQTAGKLRESLRQALDHFDPEGDDPGAREMVLVGHSMGGLLSRMQAIDPKDHLWDSLLSRPPEELRVSDALRRRLEGELLFAPHSEVKRLIFIATPHRGSNLASTNIVRRLASLIRLPVDTLVMSQQLLRGNTGAFSPEIRDWGIYNFLSLGMLSEKHPLYKGLNAVPIPVEHHSIIGRLGKNGRFSQSDGVVPYWSSHLPTAESEKIVPHWHGCVEQPEVVAEVIRVLRLHLRENGMSAE